MQRTLRTAAAQFATEFDTELSQHAGRPAGGRPDRSATELDRATRSATRPGSNSAGEPRLLRDVLARRHDSRGTALPEPDVMDARRSASLTGRGCNFDEVERPGARPSTSRSGPRTSTGCAARWRRRFTGLARCNAAATSEIRRSRRREAVARRSRSATTYTLVAPVTLFDSPPIATARRRSPSSASRSCGSTRP